MAVSLKHNFVSAKVDSVDTTLVQPSNWNAEHTLTLATSSILGRSSAGTGVAQEIPVGTGVFTALGTSIGSAGAFVTNTSPTLFGLTTISSGEARLDLTATNVNGRNFNLYSGGGGNVGAGAFAITENGATLRFVIIGGGTGESMRIDASGNVGIGTTNPTSRLQVTSAGTALAQFTGAEYSQIRHSDGTRTLFTQVYNNLAVIGTESNTPFGFWTNNSEKMRLDASGNLGIGTTSPGSVLDVRFATSPATNNGNGTNVLRAWTSNALAADAGGAISLGGTATTGGVPAAFGQIAGRKVNATSADYAGYLQFSVNNAVGTMAEVMRLDASGNLGIGATPSPWFADRRVMQLGSGASVNGSAATSSFVEVGSNFYQNASSADVYVASSTASKYRQLSGVHSWFTAPSGTAGNAISFTQAMTLDASGNLGVGTTSFSYRLQVQVPAGAQNIFLAGQTGISNGYQITSNGTALTYQWFNTSSEAMRLDASGNLGVGTTNATRRLTVSSSTNSYIGHQIAGIEKWVAGADDSSRYVVYDSTAAANRFMIDASGNLGLGMTPSAWSGSKALEVSVLGTAITAFSANNSQFVSNTYFNGTNWIYTATNSANKYQLNAGAFVWDNAASGTAGTTATFTERMRLDASGNLGIGATPSPWGSNFKALDIGGNVGIAGFSNSMYQLANAYAENAAYRYKASTFASAYLQTTGQHQWFTAPSGTAGNVITFTQAMTLDASGNLIIGTAALATTATAGFPWIPSCAGVPTGAPTAPYTNAAAMVVDTTNNRLYVRVGTTWRFVTLT